jgi:hypothetical protein
MPCLLVYGLGLLPDPESPVTAPDSVIHENDLKAAEKAFLDAVIVCHGIHDRPTQEDFVRAMRVMVDYAQQAQDNPPEGTPSLIVKRWLAPLSDLDRIKVAAAAFVLFGATKPNIFQVRAAHRTVFGDELPE